MTSIFSIERKNSLSELALAPAQKPYKHTKCENALLIIGNVAGIGAIVFGSIAAAAYCKEGFAKGMGLYGSSAGRMAIGVGFGMGGAIVLLSNVMWQVRKKTHNEDNAEPESSLSSADKENLRLNKELFDLDESNERNINYKANKIKDRIILVARDVRSDIHIFYNQITQHMYLEKDKWYSDHPFPADKEPDVRIINDLIKGYNEFIDRAGFGVIGYTAVRIDFLCGIHYP